MREASMIADKQYEEVTIVEVHEVPAGGWSIKRSDGWEFYVPAGSPVEPKAGMTARFYGRRIGYVVRGLQLNGTTVFYRTEAEDEKYQREQQFGATAEEWLRRWDAGDSVWSVEMGRLGPGYEQAIQITVAEILRHLLAEKYDHANWANEDGWKKDLAQIEAACFKNKIVSDLGLSGAQWGAAMNVATTLYMRGPIAALGGEAVKDRLIRVSRRFPGASA